MYKVHCRFLKSFFNYRNLETPQFLIHVVNCGMEQWQLVGLITQRSSVRVWLPLLRERASSTIIKIERWGLSFFHPLETLNIEY